MIVEPGHLEKEKELDELKKYKEDMEYQKAQEAEAREVLRLKNCEKHKEQIYCFFEFITYNQFDYRKRKRKKSKFEGLEEANKELSKSLQETKRGVKRLNGAVRELFEK